MPIKVACACGAAFAAKDELAGRTVACPKCKQPLKIPAPQAAPVSAATPHANADLFDAVGIKARDTSVPRCPSCAAEMAPTAILCVKCGFNTKLGKRMQTISMSGGAAAVATGGGGGHGAHGDATAMLMARAAQAAEEDAEAEKTKTMEGMPLWVLLTGLFACVLFGIVMSLIPQQTALAGTGWLLIFAAALLHLYSWIGIIATAAKKNPLYGLGVFFGEIVVNATLVGIGFLISWATESGEVGASIRILTGSVAITYALMNTEDCAQFLLFMWISKILVIIGAVLLFIGGLIAAAAEKEGSHLPQPWQPAVVKTAAACIQPLHSACHT